jgi:hypothetical protein
VAFECGSHLREIGPSAFFSAIRCDPSRFRLRLVFSDEIVFASAILFDR